MGRLSGGRFECPPPVLPEKISFASAEVSSPQDESNRHEKLMFDRERIGPVNLVAETELDDLDEARTTNAAEREQQGSSEERRVGKVGVRTRIYRWSAFLTKKICTQS